MLLAASPRGGFGLRLVFNVLWIGAAAWYFYGPDTVSTSGGPGVIVTNDGTRVDMQGEADSTSARIENEANRLDRIVDWRARQRIEEAKEHRLWLEQQALEEEQRRLRSRQVLSGDGLRDAPGVRVNRGLPGTADGPRMIRVPPME